MSSQTSEESSCYSESEIAEMRIVFERHDADKSGIMDEHEFTECLNVMEYNYNPEFVVEILKLVFEDEYKQKRGHLSFTDFVEFMSEFEPVHDQVLEQIESKLDRADITSVTESIDVNACILQLLKSVHFVNGALVFTDVDQQIQKMKNEHNTDEPPPLSSGTNIATNQMQSAILSIPAQDLQPETTEESSSVLELESAATQMLGDNDNGISTEQQQLPPPHAPLSSAGSVFMAWTNAQVVQWLSSYFSRVSPQDLQRTQLLQQCIDIVHQQQWTAAELIQILSPPPSASDNGVSNHNINIDGNMVCFTENTDVYQFMLQLLNELKCVDVDIQVLLDYYQSIQQMQPQPQPQPQSPPRQQMPPETQQQNQPALNLQTNASMAVMDDDDERYMQNVWQQILRYFDVDNDGHIHAYEEMPLALRSLGIHTKEEDLRALIQEIDIDQDSTIDYSEFKQYYTKLFAQKLQLGIDTEYVSELFSKYDVDHSGTLDYNEFAFVMKKLCSCASASNASNMLSETEISQMIEYIDTGKDGQINLTEFLDFLNLATTAHANDHVHGHGHGHGHPPPDIEMKAQFVLKKVIRNSIPQPYEYLQTFACMPQHFRQSYLAEVAHKNQYKSKYRLSRNIKPRVDARNGITLEFIQIQPSNNGAAGGHINASTANMNGNQNNKNNNNDSLQNEDIKSKSSVFYNITRKLSDTEIAINAVNHSSSNAQIKLSNIRVFKIVDVSGVPLPQSIAIQSRILKRQIRVCLFKKCVPDTYEQISNVFTIPVCYNENEVDQWKVGDHIWRQQQSNNNNNNNKGNGSATSATVKEWNTFAIAIDTQKYAGQALQLFIELCIVLKPGYSSSSASAATQQSPTMNTNANTNMTMNASVNNAPAPAHKNPKQNIEMSCGWCKLDMDEIVAIPKRSNFDMLTTHKLEIHGGSIIHATAKISKTDVPNNTITQGKFTFRKMGQFLKNGFSQFQSLLTVEQMFFTPKEIFADLDLNDITPMDHHNSNWSARRSAATKTKVKAKEKTKNINGTQYPSSVLQWLPNNDNSKSNKTSALILPLCCLPLMRLHYQMLGYLWLDEIIQSHNKILFASSTTVTQQSEYDFSALFNQQNIHLSIFYAIVDNPNLLLLLIDEWTHLKSIQKIDAKYNWYFSDHKKDNRFKVQAFQQLLFYKFLPFLLNVSIHSGFGDNNNNSNNRDGGDMYTLDEKQYMFAQNIVCVSRPFNLNEKNRNSNGQRNTTTTTTNMNSELLSKILLGKKPVPTFTPLAFKPFDTHSVLV